MKNYRSIVVLLAILLLWPLGKTFAYSPSSIPYLPAPNSVAIDAGSDDAFRTSIAFDAKGNALTVFEQKTEGIYRMYSNRYVIGEGWEKPRIIDAGEGNAYRGKVAFDGGGNAIAVFKQGDKGNYRVYANRYIDGTGWRGAVPIDSGTGNVDGQQVAFDGEGNAAVVFEQYDGIAYRIYVNQFVKGEGWKGAVRIDQKAKGKIQQSAIKNQSLPHAQNDSDNAYFPYPAFDSRGNLYVIYYREIEESLDVCMSRYDMGLRQWDDPFYISSNRVAVKKEDWNNKKIGVSRGLKGIYNPIFLDELKKRVYSGDYQYRNGWWVTPSKMDARFRSAYTPSLLVNDNGDVTAFFVRWDGEHLRGYSAAYESRKEKGWTKPILIDAGTSLDASVVGDVEHVRASLSQGGEIAVVFTQWINGNLRVHARTYRPEKGWGKVDIIDAGAKDAYNPSVVFASNGTIVVVWCQWVNSAVKSFTNNYQKDIGWGKAVRLEHEQGETCGVKVAAGPEGKVIAIYEQEGIYPGSRVPVNRMFAVELK